MKKIFIYYSLTGNGDIVADYLKEKGYDIRKVIPKNKLPKNFFLSMMVGGFKSLTNKKDKLIDFNTDISGYDEIIIGSPIWNDRLCSPINTIFNELDFNNKKLSFILYSGSGIANTAIERIKKSYNSKTVVLKSPKKNKDELNKIKDVL